MDFSNNILPHACSIEDTFQTLHTSPHGLSDDEAARRLRLFGKNILREEKVSKWALLLRQFQSALVVILVIASMISILLGEWVDFFVIIAILIINGLIGFFQELKAESSLAALKKLTESRHKVMRGGALVFINSSELVPGDYIIIHEGEIVTADIRLVESSGLMVDEASITGESIPAEKDHSVVVGEKALPYELKNSLLTGTMVVRGMGKGVVVHTGSKTYLASIADRAQEVSPETPLTRSLQFFSRWYVAGLILLFSALSVIGYFQDRSFLELAYILLASLVSAVPEGLPIVLTLVMVIGAQALSKRNTLIRFLPSVETLGSATVIASDKTGTITEGKLIVKEVFAHNHQKLQHIAALCNDAHEGSGDPIDVALAAWVEEYDEMRKKYPRKWAYSFDTRLMLMATVNQIDHQEELLVKGAYESLRKRAAHPDKLKELDDQFHLFVHQGLRVLAFGTSSSQHKDPSHWEIDIVGLIGFLDPPKAGVFEAVRAAKLAGIRVIMITGDHAITAQAIARQVGIFEEKDTCLTGEEIDRLSDEELIKALSRATVLARILPEHKYKIVKLLQYHKAIVAVTGDGINDVPALKAADLGIAMGSGTEAAKSASKMVITDNNLKVIVEAIRIARILANNIRKVIYYLVSTSLQEVILIALSIINFLPVPLVAVQILWINIVTDGVQDKMFAFGKAEGDVMLKKPRKPEKQFFDKAQIVRILFFGFFVGLFTFFLYKHLIASLSFQTVSTIIFTSVVSAQWANGIQSQKEQEPFFKNVRASFLINPSIYLGFGLGLILHCFAIYAVPELFHSTLLSWGEWKYPLLSFLVAFGAVELRKWIEYFIKSPKSET